MAMTLTFTPGHQLLRLTTVTGCNFGDTGGTAAVDRPVALDAWNHLPYVPSSSLKGVLAGQLGDLEPSDERRQTDRQARRARLFGAQDSAGDLVFGDGELLAFPVPLRDGRTATVLVAQTLARLRRLGLLQLPGLRRVDQSNGYQGTVAASDLPAPAGWVDFGIAPDDLRTLVPDRPGPVLVAAEDSATALWRAAVDERTLTALGDGRTVRKGSLRTLELIPPGTDFVCLVSNQGSAAAELEQVEPLQLGAWEAAGCGYTRVRVAQLPPLVASAPAERPEAGPARLADHEVMLRIYEAVEALAATSEAPVARAAIFDLGPRLKMQGVPRTLAFCLAKAGGEDEEGREGRRQQERRAYRWLLRQLLGLPERATVETLRQHTIDRIVGTVVVPATFETTRLWLRRYAETLLRREV